MNGVEAYIPNFNFLGTRRFPSRLNRALLSLRTFGASAREEFGAAAAATAGVSHESSNARVKEAKLVSVLVVELKSRGRCSGDQQDRGGGL